MAILSSLLVLIAACGSTTVVATDANDDSPDDGVADGRTADGCDSAAAAAMLAPGSTFDYDPTESPADLAAWSDVVFRVHEMVSIELGDEWSTITVDQIEIVLDSRDNPAPITKFAAFGAGIEERADLDPTALSGMTALVFAHRSPGAAGELSAAIEGFGCSVPANGPYQWSPPRSVKHGTRLRTHSTRSPTPPMASYRSVTSPSGPIRETAGDWLTPSPAMATLTRLHS